MVICFWANKNFHISALNTKRSLILDNCFQLWRWWYYSHTSWVVVNLRNTCVEVCDSRSMHVWWTIMWWSRSMIYLLIVFLMSGGRGREMVFSLVTNSVLEWWPSKLGIIKTIIEIELDAMINLLLDNCFEI